MDALVYTLCSYLAGFLHDDLMQVGCRLLFGEWVIVHSNKRFVPILNPVYSEKPLGTRFSPLLKVEISKI